MRWKGRRESRNVEDRRGQNRGFGFPFPRRRCGRFSFPLGRGGDWRGGGLGLVGLLVILGLMLFLGVDPRVILQGGGEGGLPLPTPREAPGGGTPGPLSPRTTQNDEAARFVKVVLAETEDVWREEFQKLGRRYDEPVLVLFSGYTQSACGVGMRQMGPFYCPLDRKVYIDLSFFQELKTKFGAGGDFAQAYVIAHEVGHHVQTLLGIADKVQRAKARASRRQANAIQVRMELQADCLAGFWAGKLARTRDILEKGDLEEALNAASAIGDDRIQKRTQGYVVPDAFTHGSARQRARWFRRGVNARDLGACDTFATQNL